MIHRENIDWRFSIWIGHITPLIINYGIKEGIELKYVLPTLLN